MAPSPTNAKEMSKNPRAIEKFFTSPMKPLGWEGDPVTAESVSRSQRGQGPLPNLEVSANSLAASR